MSPRLSAFHLTLIVACTLALGRSSAQATLIASDDFLTTTGGTGSTLTSGQSIDTKAPTSGTTGYYAGSAVGTQTAGQIAGWNAGTSAITAQTTALTDPFVVNPPSTNDGSLVLAGNANTRLQYRDLSSTSPLVSNDYYFSLLLSESSVFASGEAYFGLGTSRNQGGNGTNPTNGVDVGFLNGALTLFYSNGSSLSTETLVAATSTVAGQTYAVEFHLSLVNSSANSWSVTPLVYNNLGVLVATPGVQFATVAATDMGAFQAFVTSAFNAQSPAKITVDEVRFGTAEADVNAVPEPTSAGLLGVGVVGLLGGRRARRRGR